MSWKHSTRVLFLRLAAPLALLAGAIFLPPPAAAQSKEGIQWHDNYQQALKLARESGKPIFLEYRCEP
jgi:hypothetical protein